MLTRKNLTIILSIVLLGLASNVQAQFGDFQTQFDDFGFSSTPLKPKAGRSFVPQAPTMVFDPGQRPDVGKERGIRVHDQLLRGVDTFQCAGCLGRGNWLCQCVKGGFGRPTAHKRCNMCLGTGYRHCTSCDGSGLNVKGRAANALFKGRLDRLPPTVPTEPRY